MTKSKKILFSVLACCVAVFSFLIPLFKSNDMKVKADSMSYNSTFISSDNITALTAYNSSQSTSMYDLYFASSTYSFMKYSFRLVSSLSNSNPNGILINFGVKGSYNNSWYIRDNSSSYGDYASINKAIINFNTHYIDYGYFDAISFRISNQYTCIGMMCDYFGDGVSSSNFPSSININNFDMRIISVELGSYSNVSNLNLNESNLNSDINRAAYNYICYTDSNYFRYIFFIPCCVRDSSWSELFFSYRKYYLTTSLSDTDQYQSGYSDGYQIGVSDGSVSGYNDGYSAGSTTGYNTGYSDGINSSNQYSFLNLFGAVLDAPIKTLTGLLDFNLLGVNLWALFTGLLTLALLIFVVKLCIGGK